MSQTSLYASIMLIAGVGIPILAALNSALGQRIGSPVAAGFVLFLVALTGCAIVLLFAGPGALRGVADAPKHLLLGGFFVAFYVLTITWIAPKFGVGNAVFFVLIGQLISAAVIDHFGLFGAHTSPLTLMRTLGIALMAAGVFVTQLA